MIGRRERKRVKQRRRILDATRALFAERGFDGVTMADVAARAGVARATVFNYFPSKHGLVEAMTEQVYVFFRGMLETALADASTPTPTLIRALFAHMGDLEVDRPFYAGVFREMMKILSGLSEGGSAQAARVETEELLIRLIERGQARGELAPEPPARAVAQAFEDLSNGTIVRWLYAEAGGSLRDRMRASADVLLWGVTRRRAAGWDDPLPALLPGAVDHGDVAREEPD